MTEENDKSPDNENQENEAQDNNSNESNESNDSTESRDEANESSEESTETEPQTAEVDSDVTAKMSLIEEFDQKMRLLRWGLFVGMLAVLAIGIYGLYSTTKQYAIDPIKEKYTQIEETIEVLKPHIEELKKLEPKANKAYKIFQGEYSRLEPKVSKAMPTIKGIADGDSKEYKDLRAALLDRYRNQIKPAAEKLSERVIDDLEDNMLEQVQELTSHSEEIMFSARREYFKLTNGLNSQVTKAIEAQLVKTIAEREERMREKFPKLTKAKQAALISHLTQFPDEQGKKIFVALFPDHTAEARQLVDSLDAIYDKEDDKAGFENSVESSIALLSALLEIALSEFDEGGKKVPKKPTPKEPKPKPSPPAPKPKQPAAPEKKD